MNIIERLALIKQELGPVAKERRNTAQNYSFRGIDDIYNAVQPLMARHQVISVPEVLSERAEERTSRQGSAMIYRILTVKYVFYAPDLSSVSATVVGEGMDSGDKASNKAMSAADKYALIQVLKIPTAEPKDSENDSHDVEPRPSVAQSAKAKPEQIDLKEKYVERGDQKRYIAKICQQREMPEEHWPKVADMLKGKPLGEINTAILNFNRSLDAPVAGL